MKIKNLNELKEAITGEIKSEYCIYGRSKAVQKICDIIKKVSKTDSTVLILGESGTGKELVANALHLNSKRAGKTFIKINCAALNDNLLEAELFGYARGAFTGAYSDKPGKFEAASGGTIFLDEIGDISPAMQAKLLRILQEREFERVGETKVRKCNVRVICATNRDLAEMVEEKKFRLDLYYRLNVVSIYLPSLKERHEDIYGLVNYFIKKYNERENGNIKGVSDGVMAQLEEHDWPGNVRELENVIEAAAVMAPGDIIEKVWLHNKSKKPVVIKRSLHAAVAINHDYAEGNIGPGAAGLIDSSHNRIIRGSSASEIEYNENEESFNEMDYSSKIGGHFPISGEPVAKDSFDSRTYYEKKTGKSGRPVEKLSDAIKNSGAPHISQQLTIELPCLLSNIETAAILKTLEICGGNKTRAAALLGISLRSLQLKVKKISA